MGRAKLKMELISNERKRNEAFKRRREGLITKIHELTTLCDVKACMIVYGPEGSGVSPLVWPKCPDEVQSLVDSYKAKHKDSGCKKFGLSDFFREKTRKVEEELAALRKQNAAAMYPLHNEITETLTEEQLRVFAGKLKEKAGFVRTRAQMLKIMMANQSNSFYNPATGKQEQQLMMNQQQNYPVPVSNIYLSNLNQHQQYFPMNLQQQNPMQSEMDCYAHFGGEIPNPKPPQFDQHHHQGLCNVAGMQWANFVNQNPSENDLYAQFGGEIAKQSPQFRCQVLCDQPGFLRNI